MLVERATVLIRTFSLADDDIQIQLLPALALNTRTGLKVGAFKCRSKTRAEAEACCAQYEHAGSVFRDTDSLDYGCTVDKGTGDWD